MHAEGALDRQRQQFRLEGLGEEVIGPQPDGLHRILAVMLTGEHDDLGVRGQRKHLAQQRKALGDIVGRRRQTQIHGDHRRFVAAQLRNRRFAIIGNDRLAGIECPPHLLL